MQGIHHASNVVLYVKMHVISMCPVLNSIWRYALQQFPSISSLPPDPILCPCDFTAMILPEWLTLNCRVPVCFLDPLHSACIDGFRAL